MGWWWGQLPWLLVRGGEGKGGAFAGTWDGGQVPATCQGWRRWQWLHQPKALQVRPPRQARWVVMSFLSAQDLSGISVTCNITRKQSEEAMDFLRNRQGQEVLTSGTVIHLVRGERPSFTVNKPTRSLDPWDIPDAVDDSADSSNQKNKDGINGYEAERERSNQWEKQTYPSACSKARFSNAEDSDASSIQPQVDLDENDQFDDDDEEFWEDEEETEEEALDADEEGEEDDIQYSVAEMTRPGQRLIVAQGGEGGLGNASIGRDVRLSKGNRQEEVARLSTGQPGTESFLVLELKSIADVGLVGLPNAGKSTLLSALSRARPEIADYAFTTLRPNIGSLTYDDYLSVKVADIPGLIKGAHENRGLGHAFLRHIERTKVLSYVLDLAATLNGRKGIPPWEQLRDLVVELEHYQEGMTKRPSLIVANKIDEVGADEMYEELKRRVQGVPIFPVCAILQEGVPDLRVGLRDLMDASDPQGVDLSKVIVD
ncbi:unnamed protein product [Triticum turgidum subsp. durum]|uniref:GTP-binding protein OBGM, mitochondrial n=1 Tax=Triticum turgidum subsp. durum TaxID=4567 RepID=A0A9R0T4X5_TRITD|nr:unnamed protein product [Triticum turgidum subsp. durum]